ncbi:MAG: VOC family protein [Francisellaceae bacterium]|jgi:catechol 2,3-dioxygenase-like lactoylglutathione lyase family enzyme|nr:VOC family protein [Francisellaceae bacterium]MBT6207656.1 VOC family protein [Francisellaceae bacterium]MBT6538294.1 VOC family protein [Francisellaceae bacterium]
MPKTLGLRHIALRVNNIEACVDFYTQVLGMKLEYKTEGYAYLTTGDDNISLHEDGTIQFSSPQRLEHFGFSCSCPGDVDEWFSHCKKNNANIQGPPNTFGVGTRGFSVFDPSGNEVEFTYHPPMIEKQNFQ